MENAVHSRHKRQFTGTVASVAGQKSVVVVVERRFKHRTYHKYITTAARYMAHDENSVCKAGDQVLIEECRPMSARKRWRVVNKGETAAK
ncbi:MAG TPA: 30S ribosomal protein S17 [Myxococcota bacterium]|nr:30S ribosomal protein S17 [Myxococcota bacterium]HOA13018.1 30S ribosomal protein S17 [Myxococcota bacterium]HOC98808.1 30S ribosomal protein S17 [Myxococcota bacterium]HOH75861.1 30S ribosomal protein S17 [Myxococcota bacterium]HPV03242.1 30S ribosomal protein S17 [Myxococcota bacterium]